MCPSRDERTERQLAKYELLAKIATGGMAEIYLARAKNAGFERFCVVKRLLPQHAGSDDYIKMFLDEGRIAAMLNHPNIVQIYDFGSDQGAHYLAMEYLHGEDVRAMIRTLRTQGRSLPREHALHIVMSMCAALRHAHEARGPSGQPLELVHRDVTPHNVIVTYEGDVKLVDFGIAKSKDREWETKHGTLKGKVPYMSPEQIKGKRIDRRSDIYAAGVMLYELVVGRRPYVAPPSNEFGLMMAIARHEIKPPTVFDPTIPPTLERIILTAMAYDPGARYASARDLHAELEAFAREERLNVSSLALSAFMEDLFGAKVEAWRAAKQSPHELAAHVVQREERRVHDEASFSDDEGAVASDPHLPGAHPSAATLLASTSAAVASVAEIGGVTIVTLQGKVDESFEGAVLARTLSGLVVFDLGGVERITSFGVREWLEMMSGIDEAADCEVYLARCSEPIVTQMSLIRAFAGRARVVSFEAPFLCDDCGNGFKGTIDCERDAELVRASHAPAAACPRCGGAAKLDDDASYLSFALPFAGQPVPERVRALVTQMEQASRRGTEPIDKLVTASETRLRVHRDLDASFRWNRVLDGIEGKVVIDFHGATRLPKEGATSFVRAVRGLGPEVTSCRLVECPVAIVEALGPTARIDAPSSGGRVELESIAFEGRCPACSATRAGVLPTSELSDALAEHREPFAPCRRCNGPLELAAADTARSLLFGLPPPEKPPAARASLPGEAAPASLSTTATNAEVSVARERQPGASGQGRKRLAAASLLVVGALGGGVVAMTARRLPSAEPPTDAKESEPRRATASSAPLLTGASAVTAVVAPPATSAESDVGERAPERAVERAEGGVYVSATARARDEDTALADVRAAAIARLTEELERDLPARVRDALGVATSMREAAPKAPVQLAARFTRQVGAFASPERVDVRVRSEGQDTVISARYRMSSEAWARALEYYATTKDVAGLTLANAYPTAGEGLLVVETKAARSVTKGSVLTMLDGQPATTLEALSALPAGRHDARFAARGGRFEVKLHFK